jgi:hypothetical protein
MQKSSNPIFMEGYSGRPFLRHISAFASRLRVAFQNTSDRSAAGAPVRGDRADALARMRQREPGKLPIRIPGV